MFVMLHFNENVVKTDDWAMDDEERKEKLAAARKKLKAYQNKSSKPTSKGEVPAKAKTDISSNSYHPTILEDNLQNQALNSSSSNSEASKASCSSSETLRQISKQLNGLVSQTDNNSNGFNSDLSSSNVIDLEKRNQELASLLETQKQTCHQLKSELQDSKAEVQKLHQQMKKSSENYEERLFKEHSGLREQLQVHIQTIGILVAEKTELQSALSQCQQTAKHKSVEVEGLQGRLKASRHQVSELERELASTTLSTQQIEKNNKASTKDVDRLKMEIYKTSKVNEELEQRCSELQEKLSANISECESQNEIIKNSERKIAMLELRVQQLTNGNIEEGSDQLEELQKEKVDLDQKNIRLKETIQKMTRDRDQITETYETFTRQLQQQISDLGLQILTLQDKNHQFETQMDRLQHEKNELDKNKSDGLNLKEELSALEVQLKEADKKSQQYQSQIDDNSELSRILEEKESMIEELELRLKEMQSVQGDRNQLLEDMQSDKVAASRAIAQNRELKKQLEELQDGFVKMSNNKLELTEKLMMEQHINKELGERLAQQEEEMSEVREQMTDRDHQIVELQKSSSEVTKQMYQQNQIADRMRHYEAQGQLTEMLQQELNQAQQRISALTSQNSELRTMLANQAENLLKSDKIGDETDDKDSFRKDELVVSLSASVRQLEMERNQLMKQLDEQQHQRESFKVQLEELATVRNSDDFVNNSEISSSDQHNYNLRQAMAKLEERFTKTMNEIAELSDEKQQLEYLVLQLQGETETIGDYIALYQMQRNAMKQQVAKKDEYIHKVTQDREDLKEKLSKLQHLVHSLLSEREHMLSKSGKLPKLPGKALPLPGDLNAHQTSIKSDEFAISNDEDTDRSQAPVPSAANPAKTVQSIIELISEIGSTNLMDKIVPDNFHPCPVCSGRLLTV